MKTLDKLMFAAAFFGVAAFLQDVGPTFAEAAEVPEVALSIRANRFEPPQIEVASGVKFKLVVTNHDKTPEEFESFELNREKVIAGGSSAIIFIGPLDPGSYPFFGDFNPESAKGAILAK